MTLAATSSWVLAGPAVTGLHSLRQAASPLPTLGDYDCLVEIEAVSLNYRDLLIAQGKYPYQLNLPRVPGCDGAGIVRAVGAQVSRVAVGQMVCPMFYQTFWDGRPRQEIFPSALGSAVDGTLRQHGVFPESGLVVAPRHLTGREAAALPCAYLTAWNALFGLKDEPKMDAGEVVLVQGTGGVSVAALQFATAAGATVIATTSSDAKADRLKSLGANEIINYVDNPDWGDLVRQRTRENRGVDRIIEVGGPNTMKQSLSAIAIGGQISVVGFLGGAQAIQESAPSLFDTLSKFCVVRGIAVGSRAQFEQMRRFMEEKQIRPVLDPRPFTYGQAVDAYQYMIDQEHIGKVIIQVNQ